MNASPSLTASSQSDYELKFGLLHDLLHIVDMENRSCTTDSFSCVFVLLSLFLLFRLCGDEKRIGGFDLMWNDGPVANDDELWDAATPHLYPTNTFLGENLPQQLYCLSLFLSSSVGVCVV